MVEMVRAADPDEGRLFFSSENPEATNINQLYTYQYDSMYVYI